MSGIKSKHLLLGLASVALLGTDPARAAGKGVDNQTCIQGGSVPAKVRVGQTGFQDEDFKIIEGFSGPEVQVGKARIFQNLNRADDGKGGDRKERKLNEWCIVDEAIARQKDPKGNPKRPLCGDDLFGGTAKGDFMEKTVMLNGASGQPIAEIFAKRLKQPDGSYKYELMFKKTGSSDSRDKASNVLYLTGSVQELSEKQRKVRMELQSRDQGDATKVNGNLVSEVTGNLDQNPKADDPMGNYKFAGACKSTFQAQGQFDKKTDKDAPENWVDLSGNRITMRGNERYIQDQYRAENKQNEQAREVTDKGGRS